MTTTTMTTMMSTVGTGTANTTTTETASVRRLALVPLLGLLACSSGQGSATAVDAAPGDGAWPDRPFDPVGGFRLGTPAAEAWTACSQTNPSGRDIGGCAFAGSPGPYGSTRVNLAFFNGRLGFISFIVPSPSTAGLAPLHGARAALAASYGPSPIYEPLVGGTPESCFQSDQTFAQPGCADSKPMVTWSWPFQAFVAGVFFRPSPVYPGVVVEHDLEVRFAARDRFTW
jgi:hypothetical protein